MTRSLLPVLALAALPLVGCADDFGEPCELPASGQIQAYCEASETAEDGGTNATCVFTNSADCESRMCARYIGSSDFCTIECDPAVENACPGDAFCQVIPGGGGGFCVPARVLNEID